MRCIILIIILVLKLQCFDPEKVLWAISAGDDKDFTS